MTESSDSGRSTAIVSYVLIIGVFIALSMNAETKNKFASFHIRQALGLSIMFVALGALVSNFSDINITFAMWIFMSVLWGYGVFTAIKGEETPLPIVGGLFQKVFKNI